MKLPKKYLRILEDHHMRNQVKFPGWSDMQILLCTINCHTKKQLMVMSLVFWFLFYGHSMEILSGINLYGQLMTLMLFCMVIQWFSCFAWNFLSTNNFQFLIYIVPNNSKILKTSIPKGNSRQHLSESKFPRSEPYHTSWEKTFENL